MRERPAAATAWADPTDESILCRDASTGELLGRVPRMTAADVRTAVTEAASAAKGWRRTSRTQRRRVLESLLDEVVLAQDELGRLAAHESGKTMIQALLGEVLPTCAALTEAIRRSHVQARSSHGCCVVGILAPGEFPVHGVLAPLATALAGGSGAVVKLGEHAAWSGTIVLEIVRNVLRQHGHDARIVQTMTGDGEAERALLEADIDGVIGFGRDEEATRVMQSARPGMRVSWERRGNEAMIVCDDADLERAVRAAVLASVTPLPPPLVPAQRVIVHARLHAPFVRAARRHIEGLRVGSPLDVTVDCGTVAPSEGAEHVHALVGDARQRGAKVLVGGHLHPEHPGSYAPTLLVDVSPSTRIAHEGTSGPILSVMRAEDDAAAVGLANGATTGAGVSVFSRRRRHAEAVAQQLHATRCFLDGIGLERLLLADARLSERFVLPATSPYPAGPHTFAVIEALSRLRFASGLRERLRAAADIAGCIRDLRSLHRR